MRPLEADANASGRSPSFVEYAGTRALVTGGLGFIGSHLARALVELGASVTIVDSLLSGLGGNPYNVREIADSICIDHSDLRDAERLPSLVSDKDYIFNLAGQGSHTNSMRDPHLDLDINCRGQLGLLEACRRHNPAARVVFAGSRQQYGRPRFLPVTEDHPLAPVDVNGINLCAAEAYHLLYDHVYGLRSASLRLTNTYGPHLALEPGGQGFVSGFIRLALEGATIEVYGDGSQLRDLLYVGDAVDAFLAVGVTDGALGRALNAGGSRPVALNYVAEVCQAQAQRGGGVTYVPWPQEQLSIDVGSIYLDCTRLTAVSGWRPAVGLEEGMRRTIDFYQAHGHAYRN
jgi:nucleoside-diphosphate-sugar epimerase